MLVKILKPFAYAPDVRTHQVLAAGDVAEIDDSVIAGLAAEGFICEASDAEIEAAQQGPVPIDAPVEIPADYTELDWLALRPLAVAVNGGPVKNKVAALAVIAAELSARAGA